MPEVQIAEVFGRSIHDLSDEAKDLRRRKHCPFRGTQCTKSSRIDPIGICSLSMEKQAAATCPVRFLEGNKIFHAAARIAFGADKTFAVFPEIHLLRIASKNGKRERKIGKVDFLIAEILDGAVVNFAAVEVQATYFSGHAIRPAMDYFLTNGRIDPAISDRRPDFRSSAQKRLIPQLHLKVPIFRRWGKKFFVVVDKLFFAELPEIKTTSAGNSELTWLVFPMPLQGNSFVLDEPVVHHTQWDDVLTALREGTAPEANEIMAELQKKLGAGRVSASAFLRS